MGCGFTLSLGYNTFREGRRCANWEIQHIVAVQISGRERE